MRNVFAHRIQAAVGLERERSLRVELSDLGDASAVRRVPQVYLSVLVDAELGARADDGAVSRLRIELPQFFRDLVHVAFEEVLLLGSKQFELRGIPELLDRRSEASR